MHDSRLEKLAHLLAQYSLEVKPGDLVRIQGPPVAEPLVLALYAEKEQYHESQTVGRYDGAGGACGHIGPSRCFA